MLTTLTTDIRMLMLINIIVIILTPQVAIDVTALTLQVMTQH